MRLKFIQAFLACFFALGTGSALAQAGLWGMTSAGVADNKGVIFKANPDGTGYAVQHNFITDFPGANPVNALTKAGNGKFYGTTNLGGANNIGILFEYDPVSDVYTNKFDFTVASGNVPQGGLMLSTNGKLYGMNYSGGANGAGTIYEYDPATSTFSKKVDLTTTNGSNPKGNMVELGGKLYGMTSSGGASDKGALFELNLTGFTYTKKFDFSSLNGENPAGDLVVSGGKLYGMTTAGGASGLGIIFVFDPAGGFTKLKDFSASTGQLPNGSLVAGANGLLYGMTFYGGFNNDGVLFEFNPAGPTYTEKISFSAGATGSNPEGSLFLASNNLLYGMTFNGGVNNVGTLFEYNAGTNTLTKKLDFADQTSGANPLSGLAEASGVLYGTTPYGSPNGNGVLFQFDPSTSTYTRKAIFSNSTNGSNPNGGLMQASNGMMYGVTTKGGDNSQGVLFEYDPSLATFSKKIDFSSATYGAFPNGSLVEAPNNKLYGLAPVGGSNGDGVLFEYTPLGEYFSVKRNFSASSDGSSPMGSLILAPNGKLYGMTQYGGSNGNGVIFEYDPVTEVFTKKLDFAGILNGANPTGDLTLAANGKLYGMTSQGGTNSEGVLFEFNTATGIVSKKLDFSSANGTNPFGSLIQGSNGKLYGMTSNGGAFPGNGVIFEFNPADNGFAVKFNFSNSADGAHPHGSLTEVGNGVLLGLTSEGGSLSSGVLFHYDLAGPTFTNRFDLGGVNGSYPQSGSLLLVPVKQSQTITFGALANKMYNDVPFNLTGTASSGLGVTYTSSDPLIASISGSTVTILNYGTVVITASQGGNSTYNYAQNVDQTLIITRASQTITFSPDPLAHKVYGSGAFDLSLLASASSTLPLTFISLDATMLTISGTTATILKAGTVSITAKQSGNANFDPAPDVTRSLIIDKANQVLSFSPPPTKTMGGPSFNLSASSNSPLPIVFTAEPPNASLVSISGNTVTILHAGTVNITASQPGDGNYNAATPDTKLLTINQGTQTITFNALTPVTYGDAAFNLGATTTSNLPITYVSSSPTIASISGNTVTILKAGLVTITASQAGNGDYFAATAVNQPLNISKASQSITFNALPVKSIIDPDFVLTATASSGLTVSYASDNPAVATIIGGNTIHIVGQGTAKITASQPGDTDHYDAALPVDQNLSVTTKSSQTISFSALATKQYGNAPFGLTATATSNLPVTFSSGNTSVATISGNTVTIVGVGTAIISANQAGDATYNPAATVDQPLIVQKGNQTISFITALSPVLGDPLTLTATSSSSLTVSFSGSPSDRLSITGNVAATLKAGVVVVSASQAGNALYNAATPVNQTICIRPTKPTVTSNGSTIPTFTSSSATNNLWFSSGNFIVGETNQTFTPTKSGSYGVIVSIEGCASDESVRQNVVITGDLPDPSNGSLIFPNPAKDKLYIDLSFYASTPVDVRITDLTGKNVYREPATGGRIIEINLAEQVAGMYLLILSQDGKSVKLKYIRN